MTDFRECRRLLRTVTPCGWKVVEIERHKDRWICVLHRGDSARFERAQWVKDRMGAK